jgi:Arc/MetJ family transcription regulator
MAKTLLDLDEELLAEAMVALGATTKKDAVTAALNKVVNDARARRLRAYDALQAAADEGAFDFDRLAALDE